MKTERRASGSRSSRVSCNDAPPKQGRTETYHFTEGHWYRIEQSYIARIRDYLDQLCVKLVLPPYEHVTEGDYNQNVAENDHSFICLDRKSISPTGQRRVEPCDLFSIQDAAIFYHVKVFTLSSQLSHLLNQGSNAMELLKLEPRSVRRLRDLLKDCVGKKTSDALMVPVIAQNCQVVYVIITHKDRRRTRTTFRYSPELASCGT